jgi:hypothetical protein
MNLVHVGNTRQRHQRRQPRDKIQRLEYHMGRAVSISFFEASTPKARATSELMFEGKRRVEPTKEPEDLMTKERNLLAQFSDALAAQTLAASRATLARIVISNARFGEGPRLEERQIASGRRRAPVSRVARGRPRRL